MKEQILEIKRFLNDVNVILDNNEKKLSIKELLILNVILLISVITSIKISIDSWNVKHISTCMLSGYAGLVLILLSLIVLLVFIYRKNYDKKIQFIKLMIYMVWYVFFIFILPSLLLLSFISCFFSFINLKNIGKDMDNLSLSSLLLGIWTLFAIILFSPYDKKVVENTNLKYSYYILFFVCYIITKILEILGTKLLCKKSYDRMCLMIDINKIKSLFFTIIAFAKAICGDLTIGFAFIILINYLYNILKQINHFDRKSKYKDFLSDTLLKLEQYSNSIMIIEKNLYDKDFFRYITSFKSLYVYINSFYPGVVKEILIGEIKIYNMINKSKKKNSIHMAMNSIESLVLLNETNIEIIKERINETQNLICNCFKSRMYF